MKINNNYICEKIKYRKRPKAVEKIRAILKNVAPKAKIILFCSEARGDARSDSDFDVLILEDTDKISYEWLTEITDPLYRLLWQENIDVNPMVLTRKEWEDRPFKTPFYCNLINEGIIL